MSGHVLPLAWWVAIRAATHDRAAARPLGTQASRYVREDRLGRANMSGHITLALPPLGEQTGDPYRHVAVM
jgi:hypothetical protein